MLAAGAEERRGDRGLERFRGVAVDEPGGDDRLHEAVLDEDDEEGVEHPGVLGRGPATEQDQADHLGEGRRAEELPGQIVAADEDAIRLGPAQPRSHRQITSVARSASIAASS